MSCANTWGRVQPNAAQSSIIDSAKPDEEANHALHPEEQSKRLIPITSTTTSRQVAIMSPAIEDAQVQWLEQLDVMRKAIAELNLPADTEKAPAYGDDLEFDDDDLSGTASGEDIWDIISDEYEEEYSSDHLDQFLDGQATGELYSQQWLAEKCSEVARSSSGLDSGALKEQITAILSSDSNGKASYQRPIYLIY
jgi:hypothetical protein